MADKDAAPAERGISGGLALFLIALAALYLFGAVQIRPQFSEGIVGPRFVPVLCVLLVVSGVTALWFRRTPAVGAEREGARLRRPALIAVLTFGYIVAFPVLGYFVSTFLYVFGLFATFEFRNGRPLVRVAFAVLITVLFWALFSLAFGVRLPRLAGIF